MTATRRLAAILAADVVGFSRLIGADEAATLARLRTLRTDTIDPLMAEHHGRIFKTTGDGLLAEFSSAVDALRCALAIQHKQRDTENALQLRIGLHQGDVVIDGDDLLGDGVNIAARIEPLAEPGGIALSARVREDAAGKVEIDVEDLGMPELKNIAQPVRVFRVHLGAPARPVLPLPDKPSLVVLPFQNMSGDPEQEYFADGMVEDITSALSRIGWLLVTGRNTAFTYKGRAVDLRQVGRDLGVRYALEGSVRKAGGRVRITCQLIETAGGNHIWTERFDGELADIFDLQDRITESVVGAIEPSLQRAEIARASGKPTESLDAYDLLLRALPLFYSRTSEALESAVDLLRRAIEIDPAYIRARSFLGAALYSRCVNGWEAPGDRETAIALARAVIATGTDDPEALQWTAVPLSVLAGDHPAALAALHRAIHLHPNSALILQTLGHVHCFTNELELAIGYLERAIRLSPLDPAQGFMQIGLGRAHLLAGRADTALPFLRRAVRDLPNSREPHHMLIHALTRLGRLDEARTAAARYLALRPDYRVDSGFQITLAYTPEFRAEHRQALLDAGLPE